MAFNFQVFKTRALTAIVFAAIMIVGLFANSWSYFILFTFIHFGCWYEYQKLVAAIFPAYQKISPAQKFIYPICGFFLLLYAAEFFNNFFTTNNDFILFGIFVSLIVVVEILFHKKSGLKSVAVSIAGFLYITIPVACMIWFRFSGNYFQSTLFHFDIGLFIPVLLIATIWINDTMAYIAGSLFGKTPLTKISPKKTWEGTIGGALMAMLIVSMLAYFLYDSNFLRMLLFTLIAVVSGTFGDLFESKLKRLANVKDSGNFMPGHGGFLDRFDSLLFAAAAIWVFMKIV